MHFRTAVKATMPAGAYQPGLKALSEKDRNRIHCQETRRLAGSVNLEKALRRAYRTDPIWDYGIGLRANSRDDRPFGSKSIRPVPVTWAAC